MADFLKRLKIKELFERIRIFLKDTRVTYKVVAGFSFSILVAILIGTYSFLNLQTVANNTKDFYAQTYRQSNSLGTLKNSLSQIKLYLLKGISVKDKINGKDAIAKADKAAEGMQAELDYLLDSFTSANEPQMLDQVTKIRKHLEENNEIRLKIHAYILSEKKNEALSTYLSNYEPSFGIVERGIASLQESFNERAADFAEQAGQINTNTRLVIAIMLLAGILLAIIVTVAVYRGISKPMHELVDVAEQMASGNLDAAMHYHSKNEFGHLALSISTAVQNLRSLVREAKTLTDASSAGAFDIRADTESFGGGYKDILDGVNGTLDTVVDKIHWYESLLDSIPNPITANDLDTNWTFVNKAAAESIGLVREEAIGKHCSYWNVGICNTEHCAIAKLRNEGNPHTRFEKDEHDYDVLTSDLQDRKGEKVGYVELIRDVTKERRTKRYQEIEVERLSKNLDLLANGDLNLDFAVSSADEYTHAEYAFHEKINHSFKAARESLAGYIGEISLVLGQIRTGQP